jgi:hypothetical protein
MKNPAILKKLHKPAHPLLSIAAIAGAVAVFIIVMVMSTRTQQQPPDQNKASVPILSPAPTSSQPETYHSRALKITFMVPSGFQIEESVYGNGITIKNDIGSIEIGRGGTNSTTLDEAVNEAERRDSPPIKFENKHVTINGLDSVVVYETDPVNPALNAKLYYFYPAKYFGYSISTSTSSLYPILDQVAQSFHYTP